LKKQITIRIGTKTLEYFREMSEETGVPYQNLIDSYLANCAAEHRKLHMKWAWNPISRKKDSWYPDSNLRSPARGNPTKRFNTVCTG